MTNAANHFSSAGEMCHLAQESKELTQVLSDKAPLFVAHFIAFIEVLTGIGSNGFSVNCCLRSGQGYGELETGPTCRGSWDVGRELQGLSRDSQGWQGSHGPGSLLCFRTMKILLFSHVDLF